MTRFAAALTLALSLALLLTLANTSAQQPERSSFRFEVSIAPELSAEPLDGRVLLIVARGGNDEPRFQVGRGLNSEPLFGVDVNGFAASESHDFVMQQRQVTDSAGKTSIIPVRTYMERGGRPA